MKYLIANQTISKISNLLKNVDMLLSLKIVDLKLIPKIMNEKKELWIHKYKMRLKVIH